MTSMWSDTKPIGTTTTDVTPLADSSRMWSLMSGSSHGMCGEPEREQYASDQLSATAASATSSATLVCWRTYASTPGPPLAAFMVSGIECVTKITCVPSGASSSASAVASMNGPTKPGWLK